jgi:hypothetical protein
MTERILDWVPRHDPRSRNYPVRELIRESPRRRNKLWRVGQILDQGREGACVGHGWVAEALATPVAVDLTRASYAPVRDPQALAFQLYRDAQTVDEWEGENYSGTSVLAGAKVMQAYRFLYEYRWAFGITDVVDTVLAKGPVVLGIPWLSGMYTAPDGVLTPSGSIVGGHALLAVGYRVNDARLDGEPGVVLQNSWGRDWGSNGLAVIRESQLAGLLAQNGEACVPTRRSYGR